MVSLLALDLILLIAASQITSQRRNQKWLLKRKSRMTAMRWTERRNPTPYFDSVLRWSKTYLDTTFRLHGLIRARLRNLRLNVLQLALYRVFEAEYSRFFACIRG